ncbi:MAG: S4 domain-containing protein [Bacteroidota bacterium]
MRIDKFLWSLRYFKTRSQATASCKKGQVRINGAIVKPAREVYPMDAIVVRKQQVEYELTVLDLPKSRVGPKLVSLFRKDTTPEEALQHQELARLTKEQYRKKGLGRPTKRDRRDMDAFTGQTDEEE